jgi:2-haloacid dehalogenase
VLVPLDRREFLHRVVGTTATAMLAASAPVVGGHAGADLTRVPIRAVLFDAFPVFDPRSVEAAVDAEFPGSGSALTALWRTRQFEYSWLRTAAQDYADFWQCTADALRFAAASLRLELDQARHDRLLHAFLTLRPWPDASAALRTLRQDGVRLGLLSNFTPAMLDAAIDGSGLSGIFEDVLSTHRVRTYKPDPRAYRLGVDTLGIPREQILFVAFAGWDAAGAARFGYPTYWVNRLQAPPEELGHAPDGVGRSLADVVAFLAARR